MMLSVEVTVMMIVPQEEIKAVHHRVVIGKQAIHILAVEIGDSLKLMFFHFGKMMDDLLGNRKELLAILSRVEELIDTRMNHLFLLRKVECGVDADSFESMHLLGIQGTHAGTHNQIRPPLLAHRFQVRQCFLRVNGNVKGKHQKFGE